MPSFSKESEQQPRAKNTMLVVCFASHWLLFMTLLHYPKHFVRKSYLNLRILNIGYKFTMNHQLSSVFYSCIPYQRCLSSLKILLQAEVKASVYLHISPLRHAHNHESIILFDDEKPMTRYCTL